MTDAIQNKISGTNTPAKNAGAIFLSVIVEIHHNIFPISFKIRQDVDFSIVSSVLIITSLVPGLYCVGFNIDNIVQVTGVVYNFDSVSPVLYFFLVLMLMTIDLIVAAFYKRNTKIFCQILLDLLELCFMIFQ